ncbi:PREDICTED: B3 domain-containing protein At2g33720-like [Ipomoea nil]|uniref:B3 domain-containing protein At2g33720-like n=1 Tax=Ipomoea nil TaxID=35883 RepID=UPI0009019202|nr:PREDICTED: B3 domain-containing protein At2g33720-like [Ipomoea nil]
MAQPDNRQGLIPFTLLSSSSSSSSSTLSRPSAVLDLFPVSARMEEGDDGHWITKRLSLSDVNTSSRLLLSKRDMQESVLPLMDDERYAACQSKEGLRVKMWDLDADSEHELSLKKWKSGSFVLTSNWSMEFVRRRNLQEGDWIRLRWDTENLRFIFQKLNVQS